MRIVVLDGHTLNPGDLSWEPLLGLGECVIHPRTAAGEFHERALGADILVTNKVPISGEAIRSLPGLRAIAVTATGYNIVDVVAARACGIPVSNVPAYGTRSVAQLTMALVLELAHRAGAHSESVMRGDWARSADWCYWGYPLVELDGKTMGVVGLGRIGTAVAALAAAFGMEVIASTRSATSSLPAGVRRVALEALFREADVVTLHCPLTPETRHLVDAVRIRSMKPGAFLINTSRGPLVDEGALREALLEGRLGGAGLDVLSTEPPPLEHPLRGLPNCIITPHIAWATRGARERLMAATVENVRAFIAGKPRNVVNAV